MNSSVLCCWISTVSADVTHPLHARQSWSVTDAILFSESFDLMRSGRGLPAIPLSLKSSLLSTSDRLAPAADEDEVA